MLGVKTVWCGFACGVLKESHLPVEIAEVVHFYPGWMLDLELRR
jgi:hypothetical protein